MAQPCKFGRACRRPDCYFTHPEGRDLDSQGPATATQAPAPGASRAPGSAPPCKFDFACTRPDCYFFHPSGRAIDAGGVPPVRYTTPPPLSDTGINLPDSPFGAGGEEEAEVEAMLEQQEAQEAKDTWYPQHRNCNCCKGFIHACPSPMCADLGVCGCTLEDDDIQQAGDAE